MVHKIMKCKFKHKSTIISIFFSKIHIMLYPENTLFIKYSAHILYQNYKTPHSKFALFYKNEEYVKYEGSSEHIQYIHIMLCL